MMVGMHHDLSGHLYQRVPRVSTPQDGVFSREQAFQAGFGRGAIEYRIRSGIWTEAAGAGLVERDEPVTMLQLANALALTWPDATIIGPSAVRLWFINAPLPASSTLMCAVPKKRRQCPGLDPRRLILPPSEVTEWRRGIMIERRQPALVDSLAWLPPDAANSLFSWMVLHRPISADDFALLLEPRAKHRGVVKLRQYQQWLASGAASPLEFCVHCVLRDADIDGWEANVPITLLDGKRVWPDILFRKEKVVVEVDSRGFHLTAAAFDADRIRDNRYHASGYQTLRVTWRMIEDAPDQFLSDLKALLAIR